MIINIDEADAFKSFKSGIIEQGPYIYPVKTDIYYGRGPSRIVEHSSIIADRAINKHQESIKHNDTCRCKQYEHNDLVVMYEHIEQYPQFRCYCKWCIRKLQAEIDKNVTENYNQDQINDGFKILLIEAMVEKGIDLEK